MVSSVVGMGILSVGLVFVVISVIGVILLPDFYSRVHAAGIVDSLGVTLTFVGVAMQYEFSVLTLKILVLVGLLLVTNTTVCGILTSAACKSKEDSDGADS